MAKLRAAKEVIREAISGELSSSAAAVTTHYRGISASELGALRVSLREVGASLEVVKNRLAIKAVETTAGLEQSHKPLSQVMKGPTALVYVRGDIAATAKVLLNFQKDNEKFEVTGGVYEGRLLRVDDVKAIADLPSKDVLLAQIVGSLVSPHRGLLGVLSGVSSKLVRVLAAIRDQKSAS